MSPEAFDELDQHQQIAMLLAMHLRNELENFHGEHVPDRFMPELNSTIRYAIHDFFVRVVESERELDFLATRVPDYWEVPGRDPKPTFTGEYLWDGKPVPKDKER